MNHLEEKSSAQKLVKSILTDADAKREALLDEAENSAGSIQGKFESEAALTAAAILKKSNEDAEVLKMRACAKARVEARYTMLQARETMILEILGRVENALSEIRGNAVQYREALANLIAEAIIGIGEEQVTVLVGRADKEVANSVMNEVRNHVKKSIGLDVAMDLQFADADLGGGCVAMGAGGRIRLDNTFRQRLKEARPRLKLLIITEIEKNRE